MIYVTDNFSIQMFGNQTYNVQTKIIKKRKFMEETKDALSSISSKLIAKMLQKKVGKKDITLKPGDIIYVITSKFGRNKSDYRKENTFRYEVFNIL